MGFLVSSQEALPPALDNKVTDFVLIFYPATSMVPAIEPRMWGFYAIIFIYLGSIERNPLLPKLWQFIVVLLFKITHSDF